MIQTLRIRLLRLMTSAFMITAVSRDISAQTLTNSDATGHTPHFEITGGVITGDRVGASFESNAGGLVGGAMVFPVARRLDLRAQYLFSNQDRRFVAFPGTTELPGSIRVTASSLHVLGGTADLALRNWEKGKLYISPGAGMALNAARQLVTVSGSSSLDVSSTGSAPFASLGLGYWARASDRLGVRFELRHYVSGGGTGDIYLYFPAAIGFPRPTLARMPVQNNVSFTVSFTFRLR